MIVIVTGYTANLPPITEEELSVGCVDWQAIFDERMRRAIEEHDRRMLELFVPEHMPRRGRVYCPNHFFVMGQCLMCDAKAPESVR